MRISQILSSGFTITQDFRDRVWFVMFEIANLRTYFNRYS